MRLALVTPYSWTVPGGVNHHVEHLAVELEARGHEAWIIAPVGALTLSRRSLDSRRHAVAERFIPMGGSVALASNGSRAYVNVGPRVFARMDRAIRRHRFDLLHVHEPCTPTVATAAVLLAASPVVGTFHAALESSAGYEHWRPLLTPVINRIDVRIAVSEAAREFPARMFPGDYRIIPNGIATEKYAPAVGSPKVDGRILFIGRAEWRKGLGVLLDAFADLRARLPHATLVVAGASRAQVLEAAQSRPIPPDLTGVDALGWVAEEEKVAQLAAAQVVCAPSLAAESFGIVLAEAMAAGVPVVASDLPGYRAVLRGGEPGRLVSPNEPAQLAAALLAVLGDESERRRLAAAGLAAAERLSWRFVTDAIVRAYEDALALPFRPGLHGRLDRPWFGRALVDYVRDPRLRQGSAGGPQPEA